MKHTDATVLRRRILSSRLCSWAFRAATDAFIVGGHLRDLIISGTHSKDVDFVVKKNVRTLASEAASTFEGTVVELRKERMIRVALPGGKTLDISKMQGDISKDLKGRDFTINALGWSPSTGLIDPCGGLQDIRRQRVRAVSRENLVDDPLRLLRAYRFSAELRMPITSTTRETIRRLSRRIRGTARERITLEFFKLLSAEAPAGALDRALADGVLEEIIPLNYKELRGNIKLMSTRSQGLKKSLQKVLFKEFSQGLSRLGLLRLEILMLGASLGDTLLSVSSPIRKRINLTGKLYQRAISLNNSSSFDVFQLFWKAGDSSEDLLLISGNEHMMPELKRFRRITARGLIGSDEIMDISGVRGGPELGRIIRDIKGLQFTGEIKTKKAAIRRISSA